MQILKTASVIHHLSQLTRCHQIAGLQNAMGSDQNNMYPEESNIRSSHWANTETGLLHQHRTPTTDNRTNTTRKENTMNPEAASCEPRAGGAVPSIEQNLRRQLEGANTSIFGRQTHLPKLEGCLLSMHRQCSRDRGI